MADPANDFIRDYQALAQQSWDAWTRQFQQQPAANPFAPPPAPAAGNDTLERTLAGLKGYFDWMQAAAGGAAQQPTADWRQQLQQMFGGASQPFAQAFGGIRQCRCGRLRAAMAIVDAGSPAQRFRRPAGHAWADAGVRPEPRAADAAAGPGHGVAGVDAGIRPLSGTDPACQHAGHAAPAGEAGPACRTRPPDRFAEGAVRPVGGCLGGGLCRDRAVRRVPRGLRRDGQHADARAPVAATADRTALPAAGRADAQRSVEPRRTAAGPAP